MAFVIGCIEQGSTNALQLLNATRHRPNRLVIQIGDQLAPEIGVLEHFDDWLRLHSHIRLSDHYEDIEKELEALEAQGGRNRIT